MEKNKKLEMEKFWNKNFETKIKQIECKKHFYLICNSEVTKVKIETKKTFEA